MIEASVLVPCRNGGRYLAETLEAIGAQEWDRPWEVVFIDNGSTDASVQIFKDVAARYRDVSMRAIDASGRAGRSHAINVGVAAAAAALIISCDADDVPAPGWLRAMAEALRTHDFVAARIDLDRLNTGPTGKYRLSSGIGIYQQKIPPYCDTTGAGMMGFTKQFYAAVGGFDPDILCGEDDEFCVRAHLLGYRPQPVPDAVLHLRLRDDLGAIFRQVRGYSMADVYLAKKHRASGPPQTEPWLSLLREIKRVARAYYRLRVKRLSPDMQAQARLQRDLGSLAGQIEGIAKYRARPTVGKPAARIAVPTSSR